MTFGDNFDCAIGYFIGRFIIHAVGIQRALHAAIGLPNRSSRALWMLAFLMPAEVSSNFMV